MREIRTSGSMRGGRKRAFARRACLLLYGAGLNAFTSLPPLDLNWTSQPSSPRHDSYADTGSYESIGARPAGRVRLVCSKIVKVAAKRFSALGGALTFGQPRSQAGVSVVVAGEDMLHHPLKQQFNSRGFLS